MSDGPRADQPGKGPDQHDSDDDAPPESADRQSGDQSSESDRDDFADLPILGALREGLDAYFHAVEADEAAERERRRGARRLLRPRLAIALVLMLVLAGTATALTLSLTPSAPLSGRVPPVAQSAAAGFSFTEAGKRYRIIIAPVLSAGGVGWQSFIGFAAHGQTSQGGGSSGSDYPRRGHPIWLGEGSQFLNSKPVAGKAIEYVLGGPSVAAVRVDGKTIETRGSPALPAGDRVAVFLLPADHPPLSVSAKNPLPPANSATVHHPVKPLYVVALDRSGQPIASTQSTAADQEPASRAWYRRPGRAAPAVSRSGACRVSQRGLPGLSAERGQVLSAVRPVTDAAGELLLSCVQSTYRLAGETLSVAILLNARYPGRRPPGAIPGATAVKGQPATVNAEYGDPPGDLTARRSGEAWLVVQGGRDLAQRLRVLDHLRLARLSVPSATAARQPSRGL